MDTNKKVYTKNNKTGNILDKKWLDTYNSLRLLEPSIVEIIQIKDNKILMDNIIDRYPYQVGEYCKNFNLKQKENAISCYCKILTSLLNFGNKYHFFHNDLNIQNFHTNTNGDLLLLDPESFVFINPVNVFESRYKLVKGFDTMQHELFFRNVI